MAKTSPSVNKKNTESVMSQNKDLNDNAMAMMNNKILETVFEKVFQLRTIHLNIWLPSLYSRDIFTLFYLRLPPFLFVPLQRL